MFRLTESKAALESKIVALLNFTIDSNNFGLWNVYMTHIEKEYGTIIETEYIHSIINYVS